MSDKTEFLAGIVIGALAGIGLGMLLAPQTGQETLERLRVRADEMSTRLRSSADDLAERGRSAMDDLTQRGQKAVDEGSRRLRDAYDRGRETISRRETPGAPGENESV